MDQHPNNPLHGLTLEKILRALVERHGWESLGKAVDIRCFRNDPSIQSSLTFLRKTPWARAQVEALYLGKPLKKAAKKSGPRPPFRKSGRNGRPAGGASRPA